MRYSLILPALSIAAFSSGCYENFSAPQRLTPDVDRVLGAYGIAVDTSDRIHALYHAEFQGPGLTIRTSADGGENWDQWSTVAAYDRQNSFLDSARLRADRVNPDNLYVSYRVRCDNRQVINFRRSVDGGQNWSEAEALSGCAGVNDNALAQAEVSGALVGIYHEISDHFDRRFWTRRSFDFGANWFEPIAAFETDANSNMDILGFEFTEENNLVLGLIEKPMFGDSLTVSVVRSSNWGLSWSEPTIVARVPRAGSDHGSPGEMIELNGTLYMAFQNGGSYFYSVSLDGGNEWSPPTEVGSIPAGYDLTSLELGVNPTGLPLVLGFQLNPVGESRGNIYYHEHDGSTWEARRRLNNSLNQVTSFAGFASTINQVMVAAYTDEQWHDVEDYDSELAVAFSTSGTETDFGVSFLDDTTFETARRREAIEFDYDVSNYSGTGENIDVWLTYRHQGSGRSGTMRTHAGISIDNEETITLRYAGNVHRNAPHGYYEVTVHVGQQGSSEYDSDRFIVSVDR